MARSKGSILIVKTDGLAGFVAAEPIFAAIRARHDGASISLLTSDALQRIARAAPYFDQVAALPAISDPQTRRDFAKQLKAARFERVYDLGSGDVGKRLQKAFGMFGPKWRVAPPSGRAGQEGAQDAHAGLARMSEALELDAPARLPDLKWAIAARKDSANMKPSWYGVSGAYGLLLPAATPDGRWTASGYAGLASQMAIAGYMPVLAGPREAHDFADEIADAAPQLVDLSGKTDHLQLAALAHEAAFFVTDSVDGAQLASSVDAEGAFIAIGKRAPYPPSGRHIVRLVSEAGAGAVDAVFVWRTLHNMGLIAADASPATGPGRAAGAQARH